MFVSINSHLKVGLFGTLCVGSCYKATASYIGRDRVEHVATVKFHACTLTARGGQWLLAFTASMAQSGGALKLS